MSNLMNVAQAAAALGVSVQRIRKLLLAGRIVGAEKVGRDWVIPTPVRVTPGKRGPRRVGAGGERS